MLNVALPPQVAFSFSTDPLAPIVRDLPADGREVRKSFTLLFDAESIATYRCTWLKIIAWAAAEGLVLETFPPEREEEFYQEATRGRSASPVIVERRGCQASSQMILICRTAPAAR